MEKALKVIESVETLDQWDVAAKYVQLFIEQSLGTFNQEQRLLDRLEAKLSKFE